MKNLIDLEGCSYSYPAISGHKTNRVLIDVNLVIQPGEFVAITGPSGSGKSTLINIIGLLTSPRKGRYRLLGKDVTLASERTREILRSRHIGFIFQDYLLLDHLTALENVLLPLQYFDYPSRQKTAMAKKAMHKLGLAGLEERKPPQLSGGQKQRVAIARAIINKPSLIIADEPGSALDPVNRTAVLRILQQLVKNGSTVLMVTHSEEDAQVAARQIAISNGMIATDQSKSAAVHLDQETYPKSFNILDIFLAESGLLSLEKVMKRIDQDWSIFAERSSIQTLPIELWKDPRFARHIEINIRKMNEVCIANIALLLIEQSLLQNKIWNFILPKLTNSVLSQMSDGDLANLIATNGLTTELKNHISNFLSHESALVRSHCLAKLKGNTSLSAQFTKLIQKLCRDSDTRVRCGAIECLDSIGAKPEFDFSFTDWQNLSTREWSVKLKVFLQKPERPDLNELLELLKPIWKTEDERLIVATYYALATLPDDELAYCMKGMLQNVPSLSWLARKVGKIVRRVKTNSKTRNSA